MMPFPNFNFPKFNGNYPPFPPHNVYNNNQNLNTAYAGKAYTPNNRFNYMSTYINENKEKTKEEQESNSRSSNDYIDLFGIKLASDDLIILGLLFFLYNEKVDDTFLFIALIMLLLS